MAERTGIGKMVAECIECGSEIILTRQAGLGHKVTCSECGTILKVVGLDPVEVDWIYDEPEYEEEEEEW